MGKEISELKGIVCVMYKTSYTDVSKMSKEEQLALDKHLTMAGHYLGVSQSGEEIITENDRKSGGDFSEH